MLWWQIFSTFAVSHGKDDLVFRRKSFTSESERRFDITQVLRRLSAALLCALVCSACLVYPSDTVLRCADDR